MLIALARLENCSMVRLESRNGLPVLLETASDVPPSDERETASIVVLALSVRLQEYAHVFRWPLGYRPDNPIASLLWLAHDTANRTPFKPKMRSFLPKDGHGGPVVMPATRQVTSKDSNSR